MLKFLKQKTFAICLCIFSVSCTSAPYRYDFSLIEPYNETMSFEDSSVKFRFVPSTERIQVIIKNTTDHDINLVRERAEYIDPAGTSHNIHYGYNYIQEVRNFSELNDSSVYPVRIEPDTEIDGFVWINNWPDFYVGQDRTAISSQKISYLMEPFFPRNGFEGNGEDLKGTAFKLVLPIDFGGYVTRYTFIFRINEVTGL